MATRQQILTALEGSCTTQLAALLTLVMGLAAEKYPEEIRAAVGQVFDLTAVEATTRQMMAKLQAAQEEEQALRHRLADLARQVERMEEDRLSLMLLPIRKGASA